MKPVTFPKVIALTGYIGSGKTTMANYLCESQGYAINRFAGPLKAMLHTIGLNWDHTDGALKNEPCDLLLGKTPRQAMQTLGTNWGRDMIGEELWVHLWKARAEQLVRVVADDCRFANEVYAVRELGGIVIKVERMGTKSDGHASEAAIGSLLPDYYYSNNGSINDMKTWVDKILDFQIQRHNL